MATLNATEVSEGGKKLLGESVEESRVKRLEKQNARYRGRGGIFVPAETNPLLDVLLARGVHGESPSKKRLDGPGSGAASPMKKKRKSINRSPLNATVKASAAAAIKVAGDKSKRDNAKPRTTTKGRPSKANAKRENKEFRSDADEEQPTAGPSKQKGKTTERNTATTRRDRGKVITPDPATEDGDDDVPLRTLQESKKSTSSLNDGTSRRQATLKKGKAKQSELDVTEAKEAFKASGKKKQVATADKMPPSAKRTRRTHEDEHAANADTITATNSERIGKRKGRLKKQDETAQVETSEPTKPSITAEEVDTAVRSPKPTKARNRKRSISVVDLVDGVVQSGDTRAPPARKRPRLPTPSDSEDDLPILVRKRSDKTFVDTSITVAPVDHGAEKPSNKRPSGTSVPTEATSKKTTLKQNVDDTRAQLAEQEDGQMMKSSIQDSIAANQREEVKGGSAEQGATTSQPVSAMSAEDHSRRDGHAAQNTMTNADKVSIEDGKKAVKRSRGKGADCVGKPSKSTTRISKRKKDAPVEAKATKDDLEDAPPKRLKSVSRAQKENRDTSKKQEGSRKPKPRLSMFPAPVGAADSDDELDLLK